MAILGQEYINKLLKPFFQIRQSNIALNQTLTLKLGVTLVLTVTQVYDFVNPRRETLNCLYVGHGCHVKFHFFYYLDMCTYCHYSNRIVYPM